MESFSRDRRQNPFLPREPLTGPAFLDTGACLCSLQPVPGNMGDGGKVAWKCIGDQNISIQDLSHGKWFQPSNSGDAFVGDIYDASNPPQVNNASFWDSEQKALIQEDNYNGESIQVWDHTCTGINHTSFSTSYYHAVEQKAQNETMVDAAPCWQSGGAPIEIQTVDDWSLNGCSPGFLCVNNTANSLPQYCPPLRSCQRARLAGATCRDKHDNIPMGPFEPVICDSGSYCPSEFNGSKTLPCPPGYYCQPGAASPTPCDFGSHCPEGSQRQLLLLPLIILVAIDISLVLGFFSLKIRHKLKASPRTSLSDTRESKERLVPMISSLKNQGAIEKEPSNDQGISHIGRSYISEQDTVSGFETASTTNTSQVTNENIPNLESFIQSTRKATDTFSFGLSFGYSALTYKPRGVKTPILQNMTGNIKAGSLVAVMGGSGAGKSTFVNVLMGKLNCTGGRVTVNNEAVKVKCFKKLIGYVPQDDIVLPELTAYENILHSAKIRLPKDWSMQDIQSYVDSVIDCLQISSVRNSLVGNVAKPVLSGGERKRVSIGLELAAAPMAIFLDEPTSGLDATAASSVMQILKELARLGITIVVIIHQPRMEIFDMVDDLILLGDGQTIYEGPQKDVCAYFENIGYAFPKYLNHADIITDIITGNGRAYNKKGEVSTEVLISHWSANRPSCSFLDTTCQSALSNFPRKLPSVISTHMSRGAQGRGAGRVFQIWLSLRRALLQQYRSSGTIAAELGLCSLAGLLLGLAQESKKGVLFVGEYNGPYSILSRAYDFQSAPEVALLVSIAIGLVAGAPGVRIFSEERLLYRREAEVGHSRIAYFIAKVLSVIPRMALTCLHFTAPLFLLMAPVMPWGIAYVANLLYFYCIYGLASCISMVVSRENAPLFSTMIALITGILGGCAPSMSRVKDWNMEWLWRLSPATWMAELYIGQLLLPVGKIFDIDMGAEKMGFELQRHGIDMVALLVIGTVYRVLAFTVMVIGPRLKR